MLKMNYRGLRLREETPPPAQPSLIQGVEKALGGQIGDQYLDFLEVRNGGYMEPYAEVFIVDGEQLASPDRFFSADNLLKEYMPDDWNVDRSLLPIAESPYGDQFMMHVGGEKNGQIYALAEYLLYFPERRNAHWPAFIAKDFWSFIDIMVVGQTNTLNHG